MPQEAAAKAKAMPHLNISTTPDKFLVNADVDLLASDDHGIEVASFPIITTVNTATTQDPSPCGVPMPYTNEDNVHLLLEEPSLLQYC